MIIRAKINFSAAHRIRGHATCSKIHGHTWTLEAQISGKIYADTGVVMDFHDLKEAMKNIVPDHCLLLKATDPIIDNLAENDADLFLIAREPTCENLVLLMVEKLQSELIRSPKGAHLDEVVLWESPDCCATWKRPR